MIPSPRRRARWIAPLVLASTLGAMVRAQDDVPRLTPRWDKVLRVSRTTPTLQVVVNPPLRPGNPVRDGAYKSLRELQADYVRYVPWLPYPRLGVAELAAPRDGKTSWDFSVIDPMTLDFLEATQGHPVVLNFSTIPQWMVKSAKPVAYPADPNQVTWDYTQGSEFVDPTYQQVADYYARLLSWYTQGGFTDELGQRHDSGHHFKVSHWEVLNEPDLERNWTPEAYTKAYDAIVAAMRRVSPETKFGGISLAFPSRQPRFFEYFLDHRNHQPGVPLDFITYHFYAVPTVDQTPDVQQHTFFAQADGFLNSVRYIEAIKERLSPSTQTMINEIGAISADDLQQGQPGHVTRPIPASYWSLAGATYAYVFAELTHLGVDVAGESQLVGYPTQFPSVSMVDWEKGEPNVRFRVLELLKRRFGPGDKLVETTAGPFPPSWASFVHAQGYLTRDGRRRLLLVSKRDRPMEIVVAGASGAQIETVDQTTGPRPAASRTLDGEKITLNGLAVAVVTLP